VDAAVQAASAKYGVPASRIYGIIDNESPANGTNQTSGAAGYMQIMPGTARTYGVTNAYDPMQNIMAGTADYAAKLAAAGGDEHQALMSYVGVGGPNPATAVGNAYAARVLAADARRQSAAVAPAAVTHPEAGSLFGGRSLTVTTPFNYGASPGQSYRFGNLSVHRGVDVIPQGAQNPAQIIGQPVTLPIGGTFVASILGDAEHRGIVLNLGNGYFEHLYHIDPADFSPGQFVPVGTQVGTIAAMSGPHVHFEIRNSASESGQSIDPTSYVR
jgi:murein DD-endopeptidase MepM/ murein hydrolase activator NlpD